MVLAAFLGGMFLGGFLGLLIGALASAASKADKSLALEEEVRSGNNVRVLRQEDPSEG
jgi:predicted PurR-regulated permease PerM